MNKSTLTRIVNKIINKELERFANFPNPTGYKYHRAIDLRAMSLEDLNEVNYFVFGEYHAALPMALFGGVQPGEVSRCFVDHSYN